MAHAPNPAGQHPWDGFLSSQDEDLGSLERLQVRGRRVLITGAGGYLGSAVAEAIAMKGAQSLCLIDIVEHGLCGLQAELERKRFEGATDFVISDVRDGSLLREIFSRHRPEIVIHTAALKHVPMLQTNSIAAASTNILGTARVLVAAADFGVERCVLVSTDKAVDAVSIMGATKHIAEMVALAREQSARICVVRLCNVLGSSGSVAPRFVEQISRGEHVSVTDPAATRFFIGREEAVHCLLRAAFEINATRLAVPRRPELRAIVDLARYLLEQAGEPTSRIRFTHLRAGERLHEALWSGDETPLEEETASPLRPLSHPAFSQARTSLALSAIEDAVERRDHAALTEAMATLVPSAFEVPA